MSAPSNSGHQNSLWSEFFNSLSQQRKFVAWFKKGAVGAVKVSGASTDNPPAHNLKQDRPNDGLREAPWLKRD